MYEIIKIDIKDRYIAEQILKLQLESYKTEAKIINFYDIPPLNETLEDLINSEETFYIFKEKKKTLGVISFKIDNNILDIYKLFVSPNVFNKGIGSKLLSFIKVNFKDLDYIKVQTAHKNYPAIHFYEKQGFKIVKQNPINDSLEIVLLRTD